MWERGCFPATILEQLRRPCRPRHPYAVPRTSLQCVCTRRRNCIAQLSPSREYALRTVDFPARNSATIELTHYHTAAVPDEESPSQTRPQRTQSDSGLTLVWNRNHSCHAHGQGGDDFEVTTHVVSRAGGQSPLWVKRRNTRGEQMFSTLPPKPDIAQRSRHVRKVPCVDGSGLASAFITYAGLGQCSHVFGL